jgi:hypothetical protein
MRILESGDDQPAGQMQPLYAPGIVTLGRHPFQYVSLGANCQYLPVSNADCLGPTSERVDRVDVGTRNYQVSCVGQRSIPSIPRDERCCVAEVTAGCSVQQAARCSRLLGAAGCSVQQAARCSRLLGAAGCSVQQDTRRSR